MVGKFLIWVSIFLGLVLLMIYSVELACVVVLIGATICLGVGEIYGHFKSYKAYSRDYEASQLTCRMTCGIDHKGRPTHRIIW